MTGGAHPTNNTFEYDSAGNLTRGVQADNTGQHYRYDAAGRLATVLTDDGVGVLASYGYGASNQRLKADESGTTTYYAWDGSSVIAEFQEPTGQNATAWDKSYVYLGGRLLATRSRSSGYQYYHPDRLGTRLVTNAGDLNVSEQVYLPFGTALDAEGAGLIEFIRTSAGAVGPRLPASLPQEKRLLDKPLKEKTRRASETTARATPQAVWLPRFTR